jgi:hypothetical protein
MFGPASIYFGGYFAENTGAYGAFQGYGEATLNKGNPIWDAADNDFADNEEFGGILVVNFKINDMLSAEGGIGYVSNEYKVANVKSETEIMTYYANLPIQLADGVFVVPEIGYFDFGDKKVGGVETKQGSDTYFGAKWQINF